MKYILILITLMLGVVGVIAEPLRKKERIKTSGWLIMSLLLIAAIINYLNEKQSQLSGQKSAAKIDSLETNLSLTRENLHSTREQLSNQMDVNLITVLSNNMPVKNAALWLNFSGKANQSKTISDYLFSGEFDKRKEIARGTLEFHPFLGLGSSVSFSYSDDALIYSDFLDRPLAKLPHMSLPSFLGGDDIIIGTPEEAALTDTTNFIFSDSTADHDNSAAIAFRDLCDTTRVVAELIFELKKYYKDPQEPQALSQKYNARLDGSWYSSTNDAKFARFEMDSLLAEKVVNYWKENLVSAEVCLYLENDAYLMFTCPLKTKVQFTKESVRVMFIPAEKPKIKVGIIEI